MDGEDVVVCVGYTAGELLPPCIGPAPERRERIRSLVEADPNILRFGNAHQAGEALARRGRLAYVEIVGVWGEGCVAALVGDLLVQGVPVRVRLGNVEFLASYPAEREEGVLRGAVRGHFRYALQEAGGQVSGYRCCDFGDELVFLPEERAI